MAPHEGPIDPLAHIQRVVVIGTSGSGKTTFARRLSEATGLLHVELDALYWGTDWEPRRPAEFKALVRSAAAAPRWVAEGNYRTIRELLWPRATAIVWLDYPFATVLWRVLRRTVWRVASREVLWGGNRESFRRSFLSRESILLWVMKTHARRRREFAALRQDGQHAHALWLQCRSPSQAEKILRAVQASTAENGAARGGPQR